MPDYIAMFMVLIEHVIRVLRVVRRCIHYNMPVLHAFCSSYCSLARRQLLRTDNVNKGMDSALE